MLYKKSKYNIVTNNYIYNLLTKRYLQVNKPLLEYYNLNNEFDSTEIPNHILNKLLEYNIVNNGNELFELDYQYNSLKFDKTKAAYIIYPTLLCNFNCHYCFEFNKEGKLNNLKAMLLNDFLNQQIKSLNELNIRWSGGEPLLVWDKIRAISENLIKKKSLKYSSSMATNGYLLTEHIVIEMLKLKIETLQITVDGTKKEHNKIRFTNRDKSTYDKIIENIRLASKYLKIRIRLNIDKNNMNNFSNFLNDLIKNEVNNKNIEIFVKPVHLKQTCSFDSNLIDEEDFFQKELKFVELAKAKGFRYSIHPNFKSSIRCLYHHANSYVIDPNLNLYKCALHVGMTNEKVGYINDKSAIEITNKDKFIESSLYSPIATEECRNCKVLPICNGKCPILWEKKERVKHVGCIPEKKSIDQKINQLINNEIL